ncbi:hypothetical protein AAH985_13845, partial [Enterococcus faecium]
YHYAWLSYATNYLLKDRHTVEYNRFGIKHALDNIDVIDKRDTAYPTLLEFRVAASKMMRKLEFCTWRKTIFAEETDYYKVKERINTVMK